MSIYRILRNSAVNDIIQSKKTFCQIRRCRTSNLTESRKTAVSSRANYQTKDLNTVVTLEPLAIFSLYMKVTS